MSIFVRLITAVLCLAFSFGQSFASETQLTVFNWAYYLSPAVTEKWHEKTGVVVEEAHFDDDVERDRIINGRSGKNLDIVVLDEIASHNFLKSGKVLDLSNFNILGREHISPIMQQQCGKAGIPYFWGTLGMVYRKDLYLTPPTSWNEIVKPKPENAQHVLMMSDYTDILLPSLFLKDFPVRSTDPSQLKSVYRELEQLIPDVLAFDYVLSYAEQNPNKIADIHVAMAYSGDEHTLNAMNAQFEWGFVTPKEGTIIWVDCLAVSANSDNIEQAVAFIDFVTQPDNAALNASELGHWSTSAETVDFIGSDPERISKKTFNNAQYYMDMRNIPMTLRHRIASSIITQHQRYQYEE
ncbi:PotD/PotF family extracellular solute-binding protein [Vibrio sp. RE86]|uniref:ABC transporter substrate-binding protein n=1 Tax=Vibrio sp. RE86 TaxID=2607605 RepID=UPI0014937ABF|nr:extracellular solute-binding protein [Vibrio sp. RE86]